MFVVHQIEDRFFVRHLDAPVTLVCQKIGDDEFEPLYAVRQDGSTQALPVCFQLSADACEALKEFAR